MNRAIQVAPGLGVLSRLAADVCPPEQGVIVVGVNPQRPRQVGDCLVPFPAGGIDGATFTMRPGEIEGAADGLVKIGEGLFVQPGAVLQAEYGDRFPRLLILPDPRRAFEDLAMLGGSPLPFAGHPPPGSG
jgi:hypothetical protein